MLLLLSAWQWLCVMLLSDCQWLPLVVRQPVRRSLLRCVLPSLVLNNNRSSGSPVETRRWRRRGHRLKRTEPSCRFDGAVVVLLTMCLSFALPAMPICRLRCCAVLFQFFLGCLGGSGSPQDPHRRVGGRAWRPESRARPPSVQDRQPHHGKPGPWSLLLLWIGWSVRDPVRDAGLRLFAPRVTLSGHSHIIVALVPPGHRRSRKRWPRSAGRRRRRRGCGPPGPAWRRRWRRLRRSWRLRGGGPRWPLKVCWWCVGGGVCVCVCVCVCV